MFYRYTHYTEGRCQCLASLTPMLENNRSWDFPAVTFGEDEDRTRQQFTAEILRHPEGPPGHAYRAQVLATIRANSLEELGEAVRGYTLGVSVSMEQGGR